MVVLMKDVFTDLVLLDLEGKTKEEVLLGIAKFAKRNRLVEDEQILYQAFLKREQLSNTGIGNGIALPEACWVKMSRSYAFIVCRTKEPVDFNALDGKPVRIVLASLGRDKNDLSRLKPMAKLVKLLKSNEFLTSFLRAKDVHEVFSLFREMEVK